LFIALLVGACLTLWPLAPWLLLSLWASALGRPLLARIKQRVGGSSRAAALLVMALIVVVIVPPVVVAISLTGDLVDLANRIASSAGGKQALQALVSGPNGGGDVKLEARRIIELAQEHGGRAWSVLTMLAGAATKLIMGLFIFFVGTYVLLVDGGRAYSWFARHAPLRAEVLERVAQAFLQTGRGIFVGVGLTGLAQATVAAISYLILGVSNALVLGLLTFFASVIPSLGTALVWIPVAAGLALAGRTGAAIAMVVVGVGVIGLIDNILRPYVAHWADQSLPTFVLMVGMFGGITVFGGWGLLLGPLLLRLGMEALALARESWLDRGSVTAG
jgi:predicted PurR-regulated permease PerM